jgi:cytochrome c553
MEWDCTAFFTTPKLFSLPLDVESVQSNEIYSVPHWSKKMSNVYKQLLYGLVILSFSSFSWANDKKNSEWRQQMRSLGQSMSDLVPDLFTTDPKTPSEQAELKKKSQKIYEIVKSIDLTYNHGMQAPDQDRSLVFLSEMFREDIEIANKGMQKGFYSYSKSMYKSSVAYCIACHTRDQSGPQFPLLEAFKIPLESASWMDKVRFRAATRQHDVAYSDVLSKLNDDNLLGTNKLELEKAVKLALTIAIRVKKDPQQGLLLCQKVKESKNMSKVMRDHSMVWEKDLREWKKSNDESIITDKELITASRNLVALKGFPKEYSSIPGGEVRYLRATELMHTLLKKYPKSAYVPEALYILGLSYEVIDDLSLWGLQEKFFESCIKKQPHSDLANACFSSYKQSVEMGFSGSSGLNVPDGMQAKLAALKSLAAPKPSK